MLCRTAYTNCLNTICFCYRYLSFITAQCLQSISQYWLMSVVHHHYWLYQKLWYISEVSDMFVNAQVVASITFLHFWIATDCSLFIFQQLVFLIAFNSYFFTVFSYWINCIMYIIPNCIMYNVSMTENYFFLYTWLLINYLKYATYSKYFQKICLKCLFIWKLSLPFVKHSLCFYRT